MRFKKFLIAEANVADFGEHKQRRDTRRNYGDDYIHRNMNGLNFSHAIFSFDDNIQPAVLDSLGNQKMVNLTSPKDLVQLIKHLEDAYDRILHADDSFIEIKQFEKTKIYNISISFDIGIDVGDSTTKLGVLEIIK